MFMIDVSFILLGDRRDGGRAKMSNYGPLLDSEVNLLNLDWVLR